MDYQLLQLLCILICGMAFGFMAGYFISQGKKYENLAEDNFDKEFKFMMDSKIVTEEEYRKTKFQYYQYARFRDER